MSKNRKLQRSRNLAIGGVCAGIADYYDMDALVVRILAVLLTVSSCGIAGIIYGVLWLKLPLEPHRTLTLDICPECVESKAYGTVDSEKLRGTTNVSRVGEMASHIPPCPPKDAPRQVQHTHRDIDNWPWNDPSLRAYPCLEQERMSLSNRMLIAGIFIFMFFVGFHALEPFVSGTRWYEYWPVGCVGVGFVLLVIPINSSYRNAWHMAGAFIIIASGFVIPMSIGVFSWLTAIETIRCYWGLFLIAIVAYVAGVVRFSSPLMAVGVFFFFLFCILGFYTCGIVGPLEELYVGVPGYWKYHIDLV